ncbi:MAG TPA: ABC transporter permease [Bradyrhizobium sp.]|nr:ABC transporter permease [Bradyrhizobium sp.]
MSGRLSGGGGFITYSAAMLILVVVAAPLVVVVALSFSELTFATFPPKGFTLVWYEKVLQDVDFRRSFVVSVCIALGATSAALMLGLPAAYALDRWDVPGSATVRTFLLSPMILPILITGLALLKFFSQAKMRDAGINLLVGHVLITLPYLVRTITVSLELVDRTLEEAAMTLGASPFRAFLKVTTPQIVPGIAAGCLFAFMISFDDYPISMWLGDAEYTPLPVYLHDSLNRIFDPSIAAMSSLMILTGVLAVVGLEKIVGLRRAMGV